MCPFGSFSDWTTDATDAHLVDVVRVGLVHLRVLLGGEEDLLLGDTRAASSAAMEEARPTTKGAIIRGKTTMSRSGTSGSRARGAAAGSRAVV